MADKPDTKDVPLRNGRGIVRVAVPKPAPKEEPKK